jgi:UDPglucose 6-dehydrogenase
MKIIVIGTGYVGLVSGVCFAKIGHEVICVDQDKNKISKLKNGEIPIYEPGLKEILVEAVKNKKITFSDNLSEVINTADVAFVAVGTPQSEIDGSADLSFVYEVAAEIAKSATSYKLIVTKSTVPVGTGAEVTSIVKRNNPNLEFSVASNPEFLREGAAIDDFMKPDRIVVGINDDRSKKIMDEIYAPLTSQGALLIFTDIPTAELIKYAANSFLATKIAFINEMADLCEKTGADVKKLSFGIGTDSRIGGKFLNPGPGFGGSCFPKDILALENIAKKNNSELSVVQAVIKSNDTRKLNMVKKVIAACDGNVSGKTIAVLGLAFKGNTDDIRYSPSLVIIRELIKLGAKIKTYDKEAIENTKKELGQNTNILYFDNAYEAAKEADAIVIATEWDEFKNLDLNKLSKNQIIIDLRNMLDADKIRAAGFKYLFIGGK